MHDRCLEIRIVQQNVRELTAQLLVDTFDRVGRSLGNLNAGASSL